MRLLRTTVCAAALLAWSTGVAAQYPPGFTERVEPFAIAENLYYVGTAAVGAYLLTSPAGHILIDATLEENASTILDNVRQVGQDPAAIRVHLVSHAHLDHVGGLAALRAVTRGELLISAADAEYVRAGRSFGIDIMRYEPALPTGTVAHGDTVRVGGVSVTAHLTPGHTPGCTTWTGQVRLGEESLEFVAICSVTVLSAYRLGTSEEAYLGQAADYCRSVAYLQTLEPDIFLGSHTAWFGMRAKAAALRSGNARAFVDRAGYRDYLDAAAAWLDRVLVEAGVRGGCRSLLEG